VSDLLVATAWLRPQLQPLRSWCRRSGFAGLVDDTLMAAAEACTGEESALPAVVRCNTALQRVRDRLREGGEARELALALALQRLLDVSCALGLGAPKLGDTPEGVLLGAVRLAVLAGVDIEQLERVARGELSELERARVDRDGP
jgi:hypothetical protein